MKKIFIVFIIFVFVVIVFFIYNNESNKLLIGNDDYDIIVDLKKILEKQSIGYAEETKVIDDESYSYSTFIILVKRKDYNKANQYVIEYFSNFNNSIIEK